MGEKKSGLREGDKRRRPEEGRDKRGKGSEQEMEKEEMRGAIAARKHSLTELPETDHDTHLRSIPSCCQILSMIPMICSVSIS